MAGIGRLRQPRFVEFAPDGHSLASGSRDGEVKVWDVPGGPDADVLSGHDASSPPRPSPLADMPEVARASDRAIDLRFLAYPRRGDFVADDTASELLQLGCTRARPAVGQGEGDRKYDPAELFMDARGLGRVLRDCGCAGDWDEARAARWWRDTDRSALHWRVGPLSCSTGGRPKTGNSLELGAA